MGARALLLLAVLGSAPAVLARPSHRVPRSRRGWPTARC